MQSSGITRAIRTRKKLEVGEHKISHNWTLHKMQNAGRESNYELYHYGTCMLQWSENSRGDIYDWSLWKSTGWGSATDQQITNAVLEALGVDLYYSRKGGAHYVTLDHADVPSYKRRVHSG
jgi:hypothetical protein